jgi:hypothetical protein
MAVTITSVKARQIFDSRGNPTVEVRGEIDRGERALEFEPIWLCVSMAWCRCDEGKFRGPILD